MRRQPPPLPGTADAVLRQMIAQRSELPERDRRALDARLLDAVIASFPPVFGLTNAPNHPCCRWRIDRIGSEITREGGFHLMIQIQTPRDRGWLDYIVWTPARLRAAIR